MLFEPHQEYFGLDISDRSLKAVQLKRTLRGKLEVTALSRLNLPEGLFNNGQIIKPTEVIEALKKLIIQPEYGKFTTLCVAVSLPETKTFIKMIDIPPMETSEMPTAVKWEAEHHIPIPIDETYWDFQVIDQPAAPNSRLPILLCVAPQNDVNNYTEVLTKAELIPVSLEIEAAAITRSLLPPQPTEIANIIIDIGANRTGLIVCDRGIVLFTVSLPLSGQTITNTIADTLKITTDQAEKAKIVCGLDPSTCHGAIGEILHTVMTELISRIHDSLNYYQEHFSNHQPINEIILCGGGANFKMIDTYLSKALNLPVRRGNPWLNINNHPQTIPDEESIGLTSAIGLALRTFFIPPEL